MLVRVQGRALPLTPALSATFPQAFISNLLSMIKSKGKGKREKSEEVESRPLRTILLLLCCLSGRIHSQSVPGEHLSCVSSAALIQAQVEQLTCSAVPLSQGCLHTLARGDIACPPGKPSLGAHPWFASLPGVEAGTRFWALGGVFFVIRRILHTGRWRDEAGSDRPTVPWGCLCLSRGTVSPGMAGRAGTRLGTVVHKVTFEDNVATYCRAEENKSAAQGGGTVL